MISSSSPSEAELTTLISNFAYEDWIARDQVLMTLINAMLFLSALLYVVGSTMS